MITYEIKNYGDTDLLRKLDYLKYNNKWNEAKFKATCLKNKLKRKKKKK